MKPLASHCKPLQATSSPATHKPHTIQLGSPIDSTLPHLGFPWRCLVWLVVLPSSQLASPHHNPMLFPASLFASEASFVRAGQCQLSGFPDLQIRAICTPHVHFKLCTCVIPQLPTGLVLGRYWPFHHSIAPKGVQTGLTWPWFCITRELCLNLRLPRHGAPPRISLHRSMYEMMVTPRHNTIAGEDSGGFFGFSLEVLRIRIHEATLTDDACTRSCQRVDAASRTPRQAALCGVICTLGRPAH
jgi:hypothetical protein